MTDQPINQVTDADALSFRLNGDLNSYQRLATSTAIYPGQGTALGLAYCALKMNGGSWGAR